MTHSNNNPRSGQYITHVHGLVTQEVAAMDSCISLVRPHQHAWHSCQAEIIRTKSPMYSALYCQGGVQSTPLSSCSTQHMWEL